MTTKHLIIVTTATSLLAVSFVQFGISPFIERYQELLETEQAYADLCRRLQEENLRAITLPPTAPVQQPRSWVVQR